jgi:hypothetical protein
MSNRTSPHERSRLTLPLTLLALCTLVLLSACAPLAAASGYALYTEHSSVTQAQPDGPQSILEPPNAPPTVDEPSSDNEVVVAGWLGRVASLPAGAEFDDYLVLMPEEAGGVGITGANEELEDQVVALRDRQEPGTYAHFWGRLTCNVPDYGGCQLVVDRIRSGARATEPEPVEGWAGTVVGNEPGSQFDDFFVLAGDFPVAYGIGPAPDENGELALAGNLVQLRDSGKTIHVWGNLITGVPDAYGSQIQVTRIEVDGQTMEPVPVPTPTEIPSEPVEGWIGHFVQLPADPLHAYIFKREDGQEYGISGKDKIEESRFATGRVQLWGHLFADSYAYNGRRIQVDRLELLDDPQPPAPTPLPVSEEPVEGWTGSLIANPPSAQFDDAFVQQSGDRFGIDSLDQDIRARLTALRGTGHTLRIWGTLLRNVVDVNGTQIQVSRLELADDTAEVNGWVGRLVNQPPGSQDAYFFQREDDQCFGIGSTDDQVAQDLDAARLTGQPIRVWGALRTDVPAYEGRYIAVERIETGAGPAAGARNLSSLATATASSVLPTDTAPQYAPQAAIDGTVSTSWVEGGSGPGIGEWLELRFPQEIELYSLGFSIGYDRDTDIFYANNRIRSATLVFSSGEQTRLVFQDERGIQELPMVRAPGPNIRTTSVKIIIDDVYPGTRHDDTCLAEVEVWGMTA